MTTEHDEQTYLIQWAHIAESEYPALKWLFAVPNGTRTSPRVAAKMKAEGVRKGVADLFLPAARNSYHGLFVEMKTDKGRLSPEQKEFIDDMNTAGYLAVMCRGWEDAAEQITTYLNLQETK